MEKTPLEQQFLAILSNSDFDRLEPFREASSWAPLTKSERALLANLFLVQGKHLLSEGDLKGLELFDRAVKVVPDDADYYFQQALAYGFQRTNVRCLMHAIEAVQKGLALAPNTFSAWFFWGCVLMDLGQLQEEESYLYQALEKFTTALRYLPPGDTDSEADLNWKWGRCCFFLGRLSGEASDFHTSLEHFRKAAAIGIELPFFWNDYGDALASLALLIGRFELFFEVSELYRKVVKLAPDQFYGWYNLARSFQHLFHHTHEDAHYNLADGSFGRAAELDANNADVWFHWGKLQLEASREKSSDAILKTSLEKFARANACDPQHPVLLACWGEAQMLYASHTEQLDLLKEAEAKIIKSLELLPDVPDTWCLYGTCLVELARYFSDPAFLYQAIEKFQYGLSLNPKHRLLWYALAVVHVKLGDLKDDATLFEEAVRDCAKALEHGTGDESKILSEWGVALMHLSQKTDDPNYIEQALEKFELAIDANTRENVEDLETLYHYGCAFDLLGDYSEDVRDHERAIQVLSYVVQQDASYTAARYGLALSLFHLGELTRDADVLHQALDHMEKVIDVDREDGVGWNDWGLMAITLGHMIQDPAHPEISRKLYEQAEERFRQAIALGCNGACYHLAGVYSLMGNLAAATHFLERSASTGFLPPLDEVLHDSWLEGLRNTEEFRQFLSLLANKYNYEG